MLAILLAVSLGDPSAVAVWGRFEQRLESSAADAAGANLRVRFTAPSGKSLVRRGFWDGGQTWRVRVMPSEPGGWQWRVEGDGATWTPAEGRFVCKPSPATPLLKHGPIAVSASGTHLAHADGAPFFWMGDTVWSGPAKSTTDAWQTLLADRAAKRFSVIQYNAICPWRAGPTDADGRVAFTEKPFRINPDYFRRLDERIAAINDAGLVAAHVLIWGFKEPDPGAILPEDDAAALIEYQLARYGAHHVAWVMAGDNSYKGPQEERWKRIGRRIFADRPEELVTTHPTGMNWPWNSWRDERWLDFLGYQSGHGDNPATWAWIHSGPAAAAWQAEPIRPIVNLEPAYEDHNGYQSKKPHDAYNVRRAVYYSLLATPLAGVTYGGHGIWSWELEDGQVPLAHPRTGVARRWDKALRLPGSGQMKHVVELFGSLAWTELRPANAIVASQPTKDDPGRFVAAAASETAAVVYMPAGGEITVDWKASAAEWFDPATGQKQAAETAGPRFTAPADHDWVLVLRR